MKLIMFVLWHQDCYVAGKDFVVEHAAIMGGVAVAISVIQVRRPNPQFVRRTSARFPEYEFCFMIS